MKNLNLLNLDIHKNRQKWETKKELEVLNLLN